MSAFPKPRLTPEEYLAAERRASGKSEFVAGEVFAMAGASRAHNVISANLVGTVWSRLRSRPCDVYGSGMKVRPPGGRFCYPDVSIVCGRREFLDGEEDVLLNPNVIVEVLSESTEDCDRGGKFVAYRRITSLTDYVLVAQDQVLVEHHARQADGGWLLTEHRGLGDTLALAGVGVSLPLAEIYDRVEFPPALAAP